MRYCIRAKPINTKRQNIVPTRERERKKEIFNSFQLKDYLDEGKIKKPTFSLQS